MLLPSSGCSAGGFRELFCLPPPVFSFLSCVSLSPEAQRRPYFADYSPARLYIHTLCTSQYLDLFITFIIGINVVTMSMEHYNQPQSLEEALKYCNYVFTMVFVIEAVLKLVAFGLRRFFKDRWNQLDLAIVLLSIMGITLEEIEINASLPINPTIIRIMRVLRIARVLKLLKLATGMRALLDTVVQALPQVGNLGLLFMLLFFIYAALGVELFGKLVCNEENPCEGLSRHATFENFGMAFLTLFRVSTGDNWNGIMKDTLRECSSEDRHCLSYLPLISPIYFVTFVLIAQFVLVNVVVAVLMKHLEESNKEAKEDAEMDAEIELEMSRRLSYSGPGSGGRTLGLESKACYVGPRPDSPGQDEPRPCRLRESSQENLVSLRKVSMSRMHSLPSDSYMFRPVRPANTPDPLPEAETEDGNLESGSTSSLLGVPERPVPLAETGSLPKLVSHPSGMSPSLQRQVLLRSALMSYLTSKSAKWEPLISFLLPFQEALIDNSFDSRDSVATDFAEPSHASLVLPSLTSQKTASVHTHRQAHSQRNISSKPSPESIMFESVDPADEEVRNINSSAKDWPRYAEPRSSSLSPYISCTTPRRPLREKELKKFYSVDAQGLLAKPLWTEDTRRHSIEICPSLDDIQTLFKQSGSEKRRSSLRSQQQRKKKTSPPCISVEPPAEGDTSLSKLSENSMLLRRRTPSCENTPYRDSLDMPEASLLLVPQFSIEQSEDKLSEALVSSEHSSPSPSVPFSVEVKNGGAEKNAIRRLSMCRSPLRKRDLLHVVGNRDMDPEEPAV
ncbi:CAC1H protein, partial [Polypterus senegalus]